MMRSRSVQVEIVSSRNIIGRRQGEVRIRASVGSIIFMIQALEGVSLLGMLLIPIRAGTMLRLLTKGKDEEEAMHYMFDLFESFR